MEFKKNKKEVEVLVHCLPHLLAKEIKEGKEALFCVAFLFVAGQNPPNESNQWFFSDMICRIWYHVSLSFVLIYQISLWAN